MQQLQMMMLQSKIQGDQANIKRDLSQAEENRTNAMLDRTKVVKELQGMDFGQFMEIMNFMKSLSEQQQLQNVKQLPVQTGGV